MSNREDLYSKEAALINFSKRELADGREKDPIHKLRLLCFSSGATGILRLARAYRNLDVDGTKGLSFEDFCQGIKETGLTTNESEMREMFGKFDEDEDGIVYVEEFLKKIRPPMSQCRLSILDRAFAKLDRSNEGIITEGDLKCIYNFKDNPKYLSGLMTDSEVIGQFVSNFATKDASVTINKEEFINYYATISASIDTDAYFDLVLRRTYKL